MRWQSWYVVWKRLQGTLWLLIESQCHRLYEEWFSLSRFCGSSLLWVCLWTAWKWYWNSTRNSSASVRIHPMGQSGPMVGIVPQMYWLPSGYHNKDFNCYKQPTTLYRLAIQDTTRYRQRIIPKIQHTCAVEYCRSGFSVCMYRTAWSYWKGGGWNFGWGHYDGTLQYYNI